MSELKLSFLNQAYLRNHLKLKKNRMDEQNWTKNTDSDKIPDLEAKLLQWLRKTTLNMPLLMIH